MKIVKAIPVLLLLATTSVTAQQEVHPIRNFIRINEQFCTGAQPRLEHLERLKAEGVKAIINLRPPSEHRAAEEEAKAKELGLRYFNIPVVFGEPKEEQATEFLKITKERFMKITRRMILYSLPLVVGCLSATNAIVCAQSPTSAPVLELQTCERELKVFEDGKVLESRDGKKTERQLSANWLRKLRRILDNNPCPSPWRQTLPVQGSSDLKPDDISVIPGMTMTLGMDKECHVQPIVSGRRPKGLQSVDVTFRSGNTQDGGSVYIACDDPSSDPREWVKHRSYERFLSDVDSALGGKSILKGCKCLKASLVR